MRIHIENVRALDLRRATAEGWEGRVNSLLASGVDPNAHFEAPDSVLSGLVDEDVRAQATGPPQFTVDFTEMPALRLADRWRYGVDPRETIDLAKTARLMTALLRHGADPWGLFRQPIFRYQLYPAVPGASEEPGYDDDELDLTAISLARQGIINETLRQEYDRLGLAGERRRSDSPGYVSRDLGVHVNYEPVLNHEYGSCSVLHSLIEAGSFIQPILEFLGDDLDIERRDPQGRTLFLSACRSTLGLDGAVDGCFMSLQAPDALPNPYSRPGNPWQETGRFAAVCTGPSLLEFFVSRGADLLAVDKFGQNALHHLFAFIDRDNYDIPPLINTSLKYLLRTCPSLINQPDSFGVYPILYAIRRMRDFCDPDSGSPGHAVRNQDYVPRSLFHLEKTVYDLVATGADLSVRDSRGNTGLHYLAASKLGAGDRAGHEQRGLLPLFLQRADPRARNADGVTALEMLFSTKNGRWCEEEEQDYERFYALGRNILDAFERAGYP
ncbi:hypothetical protein N7468_008934 [Penicillium chermesinum]|uniref:Uncharacterized protein n=1 Tax=Penicillium chermesinum TaxID=63820 RepID=A0A9W9NGU8_9EURO|nr:uncharacterized protein N7468_008934 [Penicillium chermesinum]KAJ5219730.1 hypothetical protein N7468_008934 [Penicillium chermesinum]